ncbi:coiled-coil domain-containing protein [Nonomuraea gerenzanensis]|uniref:Band 7 domain-containing protein n=1 Tax=Nonomuraea gerenzanensis TaxID=93944 RepID=A0A1M4EMA2_9ACTN|nr:hypothetical protein [Nonomuraea gerenzanensis]UBU11485.1 hypothetical protein LCN96_45405 [Nonomuraea gerenzanensis]SBO99971.1 hypothetical protein BN4615_P9487 [Nonomuraea gerenzanensis]
MTLPYPITSQESLPQAGRRGPFGLGARERSTGDIPVPRPHEAVVLTDGDTYLSSKHRHLGEREKHVVNAVSYSVVDLTRDKPITVEMRLPWRGAEEFILRVTFAWTVVDEVAVVRAGHRDLAEAARAYLRGYDGLHQLGVRHPIEEAAAVRADAQLELEMYAQLTPLELPGMRVRITGIDVLDEQRVQAEQTREYRRRKHEIELEREIEVQRRAYERDDRLEEHRLARDLARAQAENERELALTQAQNQRDLARAQAENERERLAHAARAREITREHEQAEAEFLQEQSRRRLAADLGRAKLFAQETGGEPYAALALAVVSGELDVKELIRRHDESVTAAREQRQREQAGQENRLWVQLDRERDEQQEERRHRRQLELNRQQIEADAQARQDTLAHETAHALRQLEARRDEHDREGELERERIAAQVRLQAESTAVMREEREWKDAKEHRDREHQREERQVESSTKLAQVLAGRGAFDFADLGAVTSFLLRTCMSSEQPTVVTQGAGPVDAGVIDAEIVTPIESAAGHAGAVLPEEEAGR